MNNLPFNLGKELSFKNAPGLQCLWDLASEQESTLGQVNEDVPHNLPKVHATAHLLIPAMSRKWRSQRTSQSQTQTRFLRNEEETPWTNRFSELTSASLRWASSHPLPCRTGCGCRLSIRCLQRLPTPYWRTCVPRHLPQSRCCASPPCSRHCFLFLMLAQPTAEVSSDLQICWLPQLSTAWYTNCHQLLTLL